MPYEAKNSSSIYFYGWVFTEDWLKSMAPPGTSPCTAHFDGLECLEKRSGYKHLHWVNGYVKDGEENADMNYGTTSLADGTKRKVTQVIMVAANLIDKSCDVDLFHRRPTVKQMSKLIKIFGSEPSWHQDGLRRKDWLDMYTFPMDM